MTLSPASRAPTLGVSVLLRHEGAVLLVRRANEPFAGLWSLPGGRVAFGERMRDAARRELLEETGITAEIGDPVATFEIILPEDGPPAWHFLLTVFGGDYRSGRVRAGDDAAEAAWVAEGEIAEHPLTPQTATLLAEERVP